MKFLVLLVSLFLGFAANASHLVKGATVVSIDNTDGNKNSFIVHFSGGTGVCASNTWAEFPVTATSSEAVHNRAFSTALTALMSGKIVDIYNYTDDSCTGASYIRMYK